MALVDYNNAPNASVSISASTNPICIGASATLTATTINATGPTTYQWTKNGTAISGETAATYTTSTFVNGDIIACSVSSGGATVSSNAITMTVNPLPDVTVTAGGATTFCSGGNVVLSAPAGAASYQWNNNGVAISGAGATNASYTANATGSYTVTASSSVGCTATSMATVVTVNPNPVPAISTSGPNPFCAGTTVPLTASPNGAGYAYQWMLGNTTLSTSTALHNATAAGTYTVAVADANGCVGISPAFALTTKAPPAAFNLTANKATTFCAGGSVTLAPNVPASTTASFPNYQWSNNGVVIPGATAVSYTATSSGNYAIALSDNGGCGRTSVSRAVVVNANPVASISGQNPFCVGSSTVLSASPTGTGHTYRWTMGSAVLASTASQYTANAVGSYTVSVTDGNGCMGTSPAFALTSKTPPAVFNLTAGSTTTFCAGGSVTLSPNPSTNLSGFPNYQWSNNGVAISGATSSNYPATASGNYTIAISDSTGCGRTSVARAVTVNSLPAASISGQNPFCVGGSTVLNASPVGSGNTYRWTMGGTVLSATTAQYTANVVGSYTVRITDGNGCVGTSPAFALTSKTPPAVFNLTANAATTFCAGGSVTLSPNPSANLSGFPNYQWSNNGVAVSGATSISFSVTASGSYTLTASDSMGCGRTSVARAVTVNPTPVATITPLGSTTIGAGGSVTLQADSAAGYTYLWYKNNGVVSGATGRNYTANSGGSYTVQVTSGSCSQMSAALVVTQTGAKESLGVTSSGSDGFSDGHFAFSAFPNPAGDHVTVRTNGAVSQRAVVQVMTVAGAAVKEVEMKDAQTEIDLSGFASGVYLIRYKDAEGHTGMVRLVKQ